CGLKTAEALDAALAGGASHVGFIFFARSPRYVTPTEAGALRAAARGGAKAVAVTVDADDSFLDAIVAAMSPDLLQLHGKETPERRGREARGGRGPAYVLCRARRRPGGGPRVACAPGRARGGSAPPGAGGAAGGAGGRAAGPRGGAGHGTARRGPWV